MTVGDLIRDYAKHLQKVYDERTAGDYNFHGLLADFAGDVKTALERQGVGSSSVKVYPRYRVERVGDGHLWQVVYVQGDDEKQRTVVKSGTRDECCDYVDRYAVMLIRGI